MKGEKCILVVDDDTGIRNLYRQVLEQEGYTVVTADNGSRGLELLQQHTIDLVILDIRMPGMDGRDFLSRARESHASLPIVVASGHGSYRQDFTLWGADAFVLKQPDFTELKETVHRLLSEAEKAGA